MTGSAAVTSAQFIVPDASFWVSTLLPNDSNYTVARTWLGNHLNSGNRFVAPLLLVVETAGAVARVAQDKNLARNAVLGLYSFPFMQLLPMDQALVDSAADVALTFSLRGADALYVAVANHLGIPLVTFDQEQLTRPANIITTIKP